MRKSFLFYFQRRRYVGTAARSGQDIEILCVAISAKGQSVIAVNYAIAREDDVVVVVVVVLFVVGDDVVVVLVVVGDDVVVVVVGNTTIQIIQTFVLKLV